MLILTRKAGESVILGNTIRMKIVEISAGVVRLGFEAPADVSIYREEVYREISAANQAASEGSSLHLYTSQRSVKVKT